MASILPYAGGRWRAVVRRAGYKARSDIFPTKRAAEKWAREIESAIDGVRYADPTAAMRGTVRALFERFRDEVAPTRPGSRWEILRIDHLNRTADFVEQRLDRLKPEHLRDWRDARLKVVSPATVDRDMNLISSIFSFAIREWSIGLPVNPVHNVSRPKGANKGRDRRWSEAEIAAILTAARHDPLVRPQKGREYVSWAVLLAIETAMRLGELCRPTVADFHPAERYIHLSDTKNGDVRNVPLSTKAMEILTWLTADRAPHEQIFPICSRSLAVYYQQARRVAGLADADLRFHDTRHEATTRLSTKLANVLELSAVTGHRSLQSLKRYYNPKPGDLAKKLG